METGHSSSETRMSSFSLRPPAVGSEQTTMHLQLACRLPEPFAPRLRNQSDRRGREEDPLPVRHNLLGDAEGSERLSRAARHDKAAAVVVRESLNGIFDRLRLERPRLLYGASGVALFDLDVEVLAEIDLGDLGMGVPNCPLRDRSPTASRHDPAQAEDRLSWEPPRNLSMWPLPSVRRSS